MVEPTIRSCTHFVLRDTTEKINALIMIETTPGAIMTLRNVLVTYEKEHPNHRYPIPQLVPTLVQNLTGLLQQLGFD